MIIVENEGKILNIDKSDVVERLERAGATKQRESLLRRYVYDVQPPDPNKWIRLRTDGKESSVTVKTILNSAIDGVREAELRVEGFEAAKCLLTELGFSARGYQENKRIVFRMGGATICIDEWPGLSPYIEIEAQSPEQVREICRRLDFDPEHLTTANTIEIYRDHGVDLGTIPVLTFDSIPALGNTKV